MTRQQMAQRVFEVSNLKGQFQLRSGQVSVEYFDKYLFEADPTLLHAICQEMALLVPSGTERLAGLEMGGIPLATMLSHLTGIPTLFVRKKPKGYGTSKFAEGGEIAGKRLVIVEDVVTSGGQILESVQELRNLGATITDVLCVIDRQSGGMESLKAEGLTLWPLFTMTELKETGVAATTKG